jgi:hypothetical protein
VFLRLKPYEQMSLKQAKKDNKLSPKYYGPYKVLQQIGTVAYKLELPASSRVHTIFQVSCLNKVIGDKILVQTVLPELDEEGKIILEPEACDVPFHLIEKEDDLVAYTTPVGYSQ